MEHDPLNFEYDLPTNPRPRMSAMTRIVAGALAVAITLWFALLILICIGCDGVTIGEPDAAQPPVIEMPAPIDGRPAPAPKPCPDGRCPYATLAPVDLPQAWRTPNYAGGSCLHAATIDLLRWQGQHQMADYWRRNYSGAASVPGTIAPTADRLGLRFAYTTEGDEAFLEWCSDTKRGAAIHWQLNRPSDHAVTFLGYVGDTANLLDNNRVSTPVAMPKADFLRIWKASGGYALTFVYSPQPPRPWI